MATIQEAEVQFAQRLASNDKPTRTKALKKLRKYISVRSQNGKGGFTGEELLKLWKGLFYCLWMQDKPLLQEELSKQISSLLHSFQSVGNQLLYVESFLQTFKREWTGIDRLRMDKFFQLVRFMFRQTFEMLRRKQWDSSVVSRFLELLTAQILQSGSAAPMGLQYHILDLYMTELAAVGSAELTADQNLVFIDPFCKTAAKTKDQTLLRAICSSIFSTIIDQAPFAIEDLMKELKAADADDSDSGQASEGEEEPKAVSKKTTGEQMNGTNSDEEDDLLHLDDSDTELADDGGVGPVLQFDFASLADKLFELASRSNTPNQNRQRLYKIIKVLRNLSEGIFPQDEYPEEVSTDEDDEMFGSRKRMKRKRGLAEEEEGEGGGGPTAKKRKGKKKDVGKLGKQNEDSSKDDKEPANLTANNDTLKKKKKKKKKKRKAGVSESAGSKENAVESEQVKVVVSPTETDTQGSAVKDSEKVETSGAQQCSQPVGCARDVEKKELKETSKSSVKITEKVTLTVTEGQTETLLPLEVKNQSSVTVTDEASQPEPQAAEDTNRDQAETLSKKRKKKKSEAKVPKPNGTVTEASGAQPASVTQEEDTSVEAAEPENFPEAAKPEKRKGKKKDLKAEKKAEGIEAESHTEVASTEAGKINRDASAPETDATTPAKKKSKKKKVEEGKAKVQVAREGGITEAEIVSIGGEASQDTMTTPLKKTKKLKNKVQEVEETDVTLEPSTDTGAVPPSKKKKKKNQRTSNTEELKEANVAVRETPQEMAAKEPLSEVTMATTIKTKKKKQKATADQMAGGKGDTEAEVGGEPLSEEAPPESEVPPSSEKKSKKKRKIPVVFEFEADELEAAAQEAVTVNGPTEEETTAKKAKLSHTAAKPSTPLSSKKSLKKAKAAKTGSDFISFQSSASIPTPLFCKTKGSSSTPLSGKKKCQTPQSESKKVTFGLKNNKTAEFRKTDRSLLVSPEGSSRVPFDPTQKPKFGVLKSPGGSYSTSVKKTPKSNKKASTTPKSTPKRRPTAADFF